jgi:hypothetical protein
MSMVLVPGVTYLVTGVGSKAAGILAFASTAGYIRNAIVNIAGASSGATGQRARIVALTGTTLQLVLLEDANGIPLKGKNASDLTAFTVNDRVTQEEQMVDLKPWDVPVADATPVRIA